MKRLLIFLFTVSFITLLSQAPKTFNLGEGIKPQLDLDTNGFPNIAFISHDEKVVVHAQYDFSTTTFDTSVATIGNYYGPATIAIDKNNYAHFVHHDHALNMGDLSHTFYNGFYYEREAITSPGHDGWDGEIRYDSNNKGHAVSIDSPIGSPGNGIEYAYNNGSGWVVEALGTRKGIMYGNGLGFFMDTNDEAHITFYEDSLKDLYYANKLLGNWEFNKIDSVGDVGRFSSIVYENANSIHLAYLKTLGNDSVIVIYNKFDGVNWNKNNLDTVVGITNQGRKVLQLQVATNGAVNVVYGSNKQVVRCEFENGIPTKEILVNYKDSTNNLGETIGFKLDEKDDYHICYAVQNVHVTGGWQVKYITNSMGIILSKNPITKKELLAYPNPFSNQLRIKVPISDVVEYSLYNILGSIVSHGIQNSSNLVINTRNLVQGIYQLQVKSLDGEIWNRKVIKK